MFGVSISAVNKAAIRINAQGKTSKDYRRKLEEIARSAFKV
jgi:hypothetical protein